MQFTIVDGVGSPEEERGKNMTEEILNILKQSLRDYDRDRCVALAKEAIEKGMDPLKAIGTLTQEIQEIGESFNKGDLFLPDLIGAGSAMEGAMKVLTSELNKRGITRESLGGVVIGTVFGDIHTIGKDMVATLLTAAGFSVHDLGINVKADQFIDAITRLHPDILAMSALLTTTAKEQRVVIDGLKKEGLRGKVKVMVGGGAIDQAFAAHISADGYAPTAPEAVALAKSLVGK
jgi:corrinoid protein of di/trimethylamine methyltransferase